MTGERSTASSTFADIQYLTGSPNRAEFLEILTESPTTREAVQESLSVSRVTVGRMLQNFEERGWINRTQNSIHITSLGEAVIDAYRDFYAVIETVQALQPLNGFIQLADLPFDPLALEDSAVVLTDKHDPFRTVRTFNELTSTADSIAMASPVFYEELVQPTGGATDGNGPNRNLLIFSAAVVADVREEPDVRDSLRKLAHDESATLLVCECHLPPYLFGLVDQSAIFQIFDERRVPVALLQIGDESVRDWVSTELGRVQANAEELGSV